MSLYNYARPRSTYSEDAGVADILFEQHTEFMKDQQVEAGYGFTTFSLKQFMAAHRNGLEWIIPGYVPRGEVTLLAGDPERGKSRLLLQMIMSVATGHPFLGIPVETGCAVGLFHEDSVVTIQERLGTLLANWQIDMDQLDATGRLLIEGRNSDPESEDRRKLWDHNKRTNNFEMLERKLKHMGSPKLLILDTIAETMIGDKTLGEPVRHYISALQGLADRNNIAIIASTHLNETGKTSGSSEFMRKGRSVIHFTDLRSEGLVLKSVKSNCGPKPPSIPILEETSGLFERRSAPSRPSMQIRTVAERKKNYPSLRETFIDAVDNTPVGLSRSKHAEMYAPRILYARWGKKLKATEADFKAVMDELLNEGRIGEKRKSSRHPTMILCVAGDV